MKSAKLVGLLAAFVMTAAAFACAWDYDTVPQELKGLPYVMDAVVGRLEVNPPIYYEVRLKRVVEEMKTHPENLDLYDNAAVASDKLGNSDDAIKWMEKKAGQLKTSKLAASDLKDQQYRYHANLGTFYVHKWAKTADQNDKSLLKKGLAELETAIKINPDAHFGREIVQVQIIKMLLMKINEEKGPTNSDRMSKWDEFAKEQGQEKVQKGVIGMMLLGAGADSPDLIYLLALSSIKGSHYGRNSLAEIATLRLKELKESGKKSLFFEGSYFGLYRGGLIYRKEARDAYFALRDNAKLFRKNRDDFMIAKLTAGKNPDTDPNFWKGYKETPQVDIDKFVTWLPPLYRGSGAWLNIYLTVFIGLAVLIFVVVSIKQKKFRIW